MSGLFSNADCPACPLLESERDVARRERDQANARAAKAERACEKLARDHRHLKDQIAEAERHLVQRVIQLESVLEQIFDGRDVEDFAARRELGLQPIIAAKKYHSPNEVPYDPDRPSKRFELLDVD